MPELELNPVKEKDFVKKILNIDFSTKKIPDEDFGTKKILNIDFSTKKSEAKETKENIDECYNVIKNILNDKTDKYEGLKKFLGLLNDTIESVDKNKYDNEAVNDLKKVLAESKETVTELINGNPSKESLSSVLDTIMIKIESLLYDKNKQEETIHIKSIDDAYKKLYGAIEEKDDKKIRLYRGRLIKVLKKERKTIDDLYENVKNLVKIEELLEEGNLDKIKEVLQEENNKELYNSLQSSLNSIEKFKSTFEQEYSNKQVKRILLYYNALNEELKMQKNDYNKSYDKDFLGKNGNIFTTIKSFPEAMALSIKSVANSIDELIEAKTSRMKTQKFIETLRAVGKVAATPVIAAGKFVASNWYTLLQLYKGPYQAYKKRQEMESNNEIQKQDNISEKKQEKTIENNKQKENKPEINTDTQTTTDNQKVNEIKSEEKVENQNDNQQKAEAIKPEETKAEPQPEVKVEIDPNKKNLCMVEDEVKLPKTIMEYYQMTDLDREKMYDAYKNGQISSAMWPDFLPKPDDSLKNWPKLENNPETVPKNKETYEPEPAQENEPEIVTPPTINSTPNKSYFGYVPGVGVFFIPDYELNTSLIDTSDMIAEPEQSHVSASNDGGGRHR